MNRRELLASFLGLPWVFAGCGMGTPKLPPAGEIIGASVEAGHRLRGRRPHSGSVDDQGGPPQQTRSRPADDAWQDVDVVIVGGGVSGLTAARRLHRQGLSLVLLELEPVVGGTARSGESDLVRYPWGAHYLPVPMAQHAELIELLDEMQIIERIDDDGLPVVAEQFLCRDPEERLFLDGAWHEGLLPPSGMSAEDNAQIDAFKREITRWVAWSDKQGKRAFTVPTAACSDDQEVLALDRETMSDWMRRHGWDSPALRWYVDYCCRDDYGLRIDQTSAWAGLFYFAARVPGPGAESQPFITWPEGNGRLIDHLAEQVAPHVRCSQLVTSITGPAEATGNQWVEVVAESAADSAAGSAAGSSHLRGWRAKRVVFTAPPFLADHLIAGYREHGPVSAVSADAPRIEFGSWLVANLHLSNRPVSEGFPLCWDNVLFDSPSLGYVAATHQRGFDHGPTVLTYYYPLCDDDPRVARERLLSLSWAEWSEVILSDLERAHPDIRDLTTRLDMMRWGHAMVRPVPGLISGEVLRESRRPFRGIHFAHSALSGIPLFEEAFHHGNRAADEVIAALT